MVDIRKVRWVRVRVSQKESAERWRKSIGPDAVRSFGRKWNLRRHYGITHEEYDALLVSQHGVCGSCGKPETLVIRGQIMPLSVDHDHETGEVRGLLCAGCNQGVGCFDDDPIRLELAAAYLRSTRTHGHAKALIEQYRKDHAPKPMQTWASKATETLIALRKAEVNRRAQERHLRNEPVGVPARMHDRAPWIWEAMSNLGSLRKAKQKANETAYNRAWRARKKAREESTT